MRTHVKKNPLKPKTHGEPTNTPPHVTIHCIPKNGSEYDIDKGCWDKLCKEEQRHFFKAKKYIIYMIFRMRAPVANCHLLAATAFVKKYEYSSLLSI